MKKPDFMYVSYINTTIDALWKALTSPEFTKLYWFGAEVDSDWKVGSPVKFTGPEGKVIIAGKVLVVEKPKTLSYTWSNPHMERVRDEKPSTVTFLLEKTESKAVKLTVSHDDFPENSEAFKGIQQGWPLVISCLKSYLETGEVPVIGMKSTCS